MEDIEDTSGVISVDDIDFEYLNTEVHLGDISGKPDCGQVYFLSVGIEVSEDIAEEDGEFNKLDGLLLRQISSEKFIRLVEFRMLGCQVQGILDSLTERDLILV
jgi:hypothetical protein